VRRLTALLWFVAGYVAIVALDPAVAAAPAFAAFCVGGLSLTRTEQPERAKLRVRR
jgi:hypothetical protein